MLTQRQEKFTRLLFQGVSQRKAWELAGYSTNYPVEVIDTNACVLASANKVKMRLNELRDRAAAPDIMSVVERKLKLSNIARENIINDKGTPIRSPNIDAITEINKMERVYTERVGDDNRTQYNIIVSSAEGKELLDRIFTGEDTKLLTSGQEKGIERT